MTKLLEKAFRELRKLPESEQNAVAKWLLEELRTEKKWEEIFAESEDLLLRLGKEALELHRQGKTLPLDLQKL